MIISKEIETQNKSLDNLELDVERAKESTDSILKKTRELVSKSGGYKMVCIIVALLAILIVLVLMVIYS